MTTQRRLELQLTSGVGWRRADSEVAFNPRLEVELGITDRLQFSVEAPLEMVRGEDGSVLAALGVSEVTAYYGLAYDKARELALSVGFGIELPATSKRIGDQSVALAPVLVAYKRVGIVCVSATVGAEIALAQVGDETDGGGVGAHAAISVYAPFGPVVPTIEVGIEYDGEPELVLAPGALWHPADDTEIGVAFLYRRSDEGPSYGAQINASWELDLGGDYRDLAAVKEARR